MRLVFVTPEGLEEKKLIALCEEAWEGGADAVQLRLPTLSAREMFPLARLLADAAHEMGKALIVNDRADIAVAVGAAGVHLGTRSLPPGAARVVLKAPFKIGVSCHSVADVVQAETEGADYVFLGAVFATTSKPGIPPVGLAELGRACKKARLPVFAIGGVTVENAGAVISAGAAGVAVIRAIALAPSPREAARGLADAIGSWRGERGPTVEV